LSPVLAQFVSDLIKCAMISIHIVYSCAIFYVLFHTGCYRALPTDATDTVPHGRPMS